MWTIIQQSIILIKAIFLYSLRGDSFTHVLSFFIRTLLSQLQQSVYCMSYKKMHFLDGCPESCSGVVLLSDSIPKGLVRISNVIKCLYR